MQHRSDIDGLRAVAVVPVVLYHSGLPIVSGGFVGVDVFFVISGYLISRLLTEDFDRRRFSIVTFYERRVRRILPALFAMMAACVPAALILCTPLDLEAFSASIAATVAFVSNVLFYEQSGYFAMEAHYKPLLHTWSLAVEEQFYIFYPPMLWLALRYARRALPAILAVIAFSSLAAAQYALRNHPDAAFFLSPFRAWELLAGCLLATDAVPLPKTRWAAEAMAGGGLAIILYSVIAYSPETPFPGMAALVPVTGAAALILANTQQQTLAGKLLSVRPMRFIGLVSYSLYLWHWPIFAFCRIALLHSPTPLQAAAMIAAAFVLAVLSWHYVEEPFRQRGKIARVPLFAAAGVSCAVALAISAAGYLSKGWPARFPPEVARIAAYEQSPAVQKWLSQRGLDACVFRDAMIPETMQRCMAKGDVLVAGDSLAEHAFPGIRIAMPGRSSHLIAMTGCAPETGGRQTDACAAFDHALWTTLATRPYRTVILIGHWFYAGDRLGHNAYDRALLERLQAHLARVDKRSHVVLIGPMPEYDEPLPVILARVTADGGSDADVQAHLLDGPAALDALMKQRFAQQPRVTYVSVYRSLCPHGACPVMIDRTPVYQDAIHWTLKGSDVEAPKLLHGLL